MAGRMSAGEYFEKHLDWKFGEWNMNTVGNEFTSWYYDRYLQDLKERFPEVICGDESKLNFEVLREFLDRKLEEFKETAAVRQAKECKPRWKLW